MGEFSAAKRGIMDVTQILQRARDCADMAARTTGQERTKLLKLADAWRELANEAARLKAPPSNH
jgi:hypothetical protein